MKIGAAGQGQAQGSLILPGRDVWGQRMLNGIKPGFMLAPGMLQPHSLSFNWAFPLSLFFFLDVFVWFTFHYSHYLWGVLTFLASTSIYGNKVDNLHEKRAFFGFVICIISVMCRGGAVVE